MRGDGDAAKSVDVLYDVTRVTGERVRRFRKSEREQVAVSGTDLDGVNVEHPVAIVRQIGRARRVAVVGHDHELQAGARGRSQYLVDRSGAVRSVRMNVDDTTDRRLQTLPEWWQFTRRTRKRR